MPSDPFIAVELLAFNASVQRAGEQTVTNSFCRGVASSEAELVLSPEGRFATLERGGVGLLPRG